ncbi:MAG TPA: carboxypeptidase-like regulatory domain-containing protein [Planctomycetota bacterium]
MLALVSTSLLVLAPQHPAHSGLDCAPAPVLPDGGGWTLIWDDVVDGKLDDKAKSTPLRLEFGGLRVAGTFDGPVFGAVRDAVFTGERIPSESGEILLLRQDEPDFLCVFQMQGDGTQRWKGVWHSSHRSAGDVVLARTPRPVRLAGDREPGAILEGQILDSAGTPVAGVEVKLFGGLATRWEVGQTSTDADGWYRFDPVPGGAQMTDEATGRRDWIVGCKLQHAEWASADGLGWWDFRIPNVDGQVTRRDFVLTRAGGVRARLVHPRTGETVRADVRLHTNGKQFFRWVTSDREQGLISHDGLLPGSYVMDLNSGKFRYPVIGEFEIRPGECTVVEFPFQPPWDEEDGD